MTSLPSRSCGVSVHPSICSVGRSGLLASIDSSMDTSIDRHTQTHTRTHFRFFHTTMAEYQQDGEAAREIAQYLPYFPFKGIPRFYDIGGFLYEPAIFQKIVDIFVARYAGKDIDAIAG